ncbi:MAG: cysteine desulfurase [Bradyrhizobiaceae bacterium]|nr:MAG: cysteine desulfurase [Bradyrhizobiaceae bacterium]
MTRPRVYLDWNATAPLRPEARAAMSRSFDLTGNPSSVHSEGRAARRIVEDARASIAAVIGSAPRNVVFTSGGTEANVLALMPGLHGKDTEPVTRLIVSAIEHPSVLAGGQFDQSEVLLAPVSSSGVVDLDRLTAMLSGQPPTLVSVMLANNETGAIQPVSEIAGIVHSHGGLLHVDAVQALGRIYFDINALNADLLSLSAHKIGGPKGVGALVLGESLGGGFEALIRGGGQEKGRRAGTENVPGIAGFGAAADALVKIQEPAMARMAKLHRQLENALKAAPGVTVFSADVARLPNTTLFSAPGMKAETAVIAFDLEGIAVSSGSACSSGKVQPSHVLAAMGVPQNLAQGAVRLSLGWDTSEAEINYVIEAWRTLSTVLLRESRTVA